MLDMDTKIETKLIVLCKLVNAIYIVNMYHDL